MDIQLKQELLEIAEILAKYPENLQERVFEIAIGGKVHVPHHATPTGTVQAGGSGGSESAPPAKTASPGESSGRKRTGTASESYALVDDLDLRASDGVESFRDFVDSKKPKTDPEFNTVAVYYLTQMKKRSSVSLPDIYTCYKAVKRKVPGKLSQGLRNTKARGGWVNFSKGVSDITLTVLGENLVEQDLPSAASE